MSHPFGNEISTRRSLGEQVKAARKAAGLSQAAFAARIGASQATICRWENENAEPELLTSLGLQVVLGSLVGGGGVTSAPPASLSHLSELRDDLGTITDLLTTLDLMGDGIGGESGNAVSAIALQAKALAVNVLDTVRAMGTAKVHARRGGHDADGADVGRMVS